MAHPSLVSAGIHNILARTLFEEVPTALVSMKMISSPMIRLQYLPHRFDLIWRRRISDTILSPKRFMRVKSGAITFIKPFFPTRSSFLPKSSWSLYQLVPTGVVRQRLLLLPELWLSGVDPPLPSWDSDIFMLPLPTRVMLFYKTDYPDSNALPSFQSITPIPWQIHPQQMKTAAKHLFCIF